MSHCAISISELIIMGDANLHLDDMTLRQFSYSQTVCRDTLVCGERFASVSRESLKTFKITSILKL